MFHKERWLRPGGRFRETWLLTHGRNIEHEQSRQVDLRDVCHDLEEAVTSNSGAPNQRVSLRLLSQLFDGMVKLYALKTDQLSQDIAEIDLKQRIQMTHYGDNQSQCHSEHSSLPRSEYSERSESQSLESDVDSEMDSEPNLSGTNLTLEKNSRSLPIKVTVSEGTEYYLSKQINLAQTIRETIEKPVAQRTVNDPRPIVEELQRRDSSVFKKPEPPIVREIEIALPKSIYTESVISFSSDLPTLSSQDEGTDKTEREGTFRRKEKEKTKEICKGHPTGLQSVPNIECMTSRKSRTSEAYDSPVIGELEPAQGQFSSSILISKRKLIDPHAELEVMRKQRRISRSSQDFESLLVSGDEDETCLVVPKTKQVYMEAIPGNSGEDLRLSLNAVPASISKNLAVIPLTLEDFGDLEPIEEDLAFASQKVKKAKTILLKRKMTPQLPSLTECAANSKRSRIMLGMSHSDNAAEIIKQMYDRNMTTLPRETDRDMLLKPASSTPIHVTEAFVPSEISFIAESLGEPGPSNAGSGRLHRSVESSTEKETPNSFLSLRKQNKTVSASTTRPIPDTNVNIGRKRYWLRSDEAKSLGNVGLSKSNSVTQLPHLPKDKPKNKSQISRRVSTPVLNITAQKTRLSRQKESKVPERRASCPSQKSHKSVIHAISKPKQVICKVTSLPPKITTPNINIPSLRLGRLEDILPIKTRQRGTSIDGNDKSNSLIAGPSKGRDVEESLSRNSTPSNSFETSRETEGRSVNELGNSANRIALMIIFPENTITEENSENIQILINPVKQVGEEIKKFEERERRKM